MLGIGVVLRYKRFSRVNHVLSLITHTEIRWINRKVVLKWKPNRKKQLGRSKQWRTNKIEKNLIGI